MTDLGDGWSVERVREYLGEEEALLIDPAEGRVVLPTQPGDPTLQATCILELDSGRYLVRDADRQWHIGLAGTEGEILIIMDCDDNLERTMWNSEARGVLPPNNVVAGSAGQGDAEQFV